MSEFNMLFESFRNVFTRPSFLHFQALLISLWSLPQVTGRQMSGARLWLAAGLSSHWDATARFVRSSQWSQQELARALTLCVLSEVKHRLPTDKDGKRGLLTGVDETLDDHCSARRMFGISRHFNQGGPRGAIRLSNRSLLGDAFDPDRCPRGVRAGAAASTARCTSPARVVPLAITNRSARLPPRCWSNSRLGFLTNTDCHS